MGLLSALYTTTTGTSSSSSPSSSTTNPIDNFSGYATPTISDIKVRQDQFLNATPLIHQGIRLLRQQAGGNLLSPLHVDVEEGGESYSNFGNGNGYPEYGDTSSSHAGGEGTLQESFVEGTHLWLFLVVGYSLVFIIGVIGNTVLLVALCGTGGRARALPVRNHLMVNLGIADLLVTAVCVPISGCAAAGHVCWFSPYMCQIGPFLQRTPVAASTLSLALLSLDRWAAIRHPRFAQRFRERRFVAMSMAIIWILASLVSAPTYWVRQWDGHDHHQDHLWKQTEHDESNKDELVDDASVNSSSWDQNGWGDHKSGVCVEKWTDTRLFITYAATYLGTAFISPALIIAGSHVSISAKLTRQLKALSGAAAASINGDRLGLGVGPGQKGSRKPQQILIVARDPSNNIIPNPLEPPINNPRMGRRRGSHHHPSRSGSVDCPTPRSKKFVACDPNSDDENDVYIRMQIEADLESFRQMSEYNKKKAAKTCTGAGSRRGIKSLSAFRSEASGSSAGGGNNNNMLKASKREGSIIRAHRRLRNKNKAHGPVGIPPSSRLPPPPLLPTYSSQSFRSRRRAANLLAALALVFILCWLPYTVCALCEMFLKEKALVRLIIPFALFLGHAHSAINPVVSWRLNRSAFVRFQGQSILSLLPDWLRALATCRLFCYSCPNPMACCEKPSLSHQNTTVQAQAMRPARPPLRRAGTRYPGTNETHNPFLNAGPFRGTQAMAGAMGRHREVESGRSNGDVCCPLCGSDDKTDDAVPCCCCFCPGGMFNRRPSSPDLWNTSTNEAALGAFHPRFTLRKPNEPDPISHCHTSHFLK